MNCITNQVLLIVAEFPDGLEKKCMIDFEYKSSVEGAGNGEVPFLFAGKYLILPDEGQTAHFGYSNGYLFDERPFVLVFEVLFGDF